MTDTPYMSLTREQADVLRGELDTLRARVAELEADNQGSLKAAAYWKENWQRSEAHASTLREALEKCEDEWRKLGGPLSAWPSGDGRRGIAIALADECAAALATTPAASLAAHDAEVLERAATVAESYLWNIASIPSDYGAACGDAIRALAAQEVKP